MKFDIGKFYYNFLYFLHPVVYLVLKVFLGAVNTVVAYKTDIMVLILSLISYIPLLKLLDFNLSLITYLIHEYYRFY
jgi:hypothetical protein